MTENKRLIVDEWYNWIDTVTDSCIEVEDAFDLVNELADENEQLKSELKALRKKYNDFSDAVDKRLQEMDKRLFE